MKIFQLMIDSSSHRITLFKNKQYAIQKIYYIIDPY